MLPLWLSPDGKTARNQTVKGIFPVPRRQEAGDQQMTGLTLGGERLLWLQIRRSPPTKTDAYRTYPGRCSRQN